jgi:HEAT repeat protein
MEQIRKIFMALIAGMSLMIVGVSYAQPTIPKENIPLNMPADVRREVEKLYSTDPVERGYSCYNLGEMGPKAASAAPFLTGILGDTTEMRWAEQDVIIGGEQTSPGMEAAKALAKVDASGVNALIPFLKNNDKDIRLNVVRALGVIKDGHAAKALSVTLRDDPDFHIRIEAAEALGLTGDRLAVESLIRALKDEDRLVQEKAAWALGVIGDTRAVLPLIDALKPAPKRFKMMNTEFGLTQVEEVDHVLLSVRRSAAKALGEIKDMRAVGPLISVLREKALFFHKDVEKALKDITGKDFDDEPDKWKEWWDKNKAK